MSGDSSTDQGNANVRNFGEVPAEEPTGEPWEGNPHANSPESWLIHDPDSWARSILFEVLRWMEPETVAVEATLRLRGRRLDDGSLRVHLTWPGGFEPSHRITLRP